MTWSTRIRRAITPARAATAVIVIVAVVGGVYAWITRPVVRIPIAIAPFANHTGEPELDAYRMALTQALVDEVSDSPNVRVVPYLRLLEIVRRFIGAGDVSSSEAIQAIATQGGASFVVIPSLEYRNAMWQAQAQVRSVQTGAVVETYESEAVSSSLPKDTVLRLTVSLRDGIETYLKANGPGRSYTRRPASARFRSLDAVQAFEEGLNAYEQLEYSTALAAFERATSLDDQHASAQAWLSRVRMLMSRRNEAIVAARQAKQLITDLPESDVAFIEAALAESQSDAAAAERRYRAEADRHPDELAGQIELADFLKRQNRVQAAITGYQTTLKIDGGYARVHVDLCQLYVQLNDYPLAEAQAETALEKFRASGDRGGEAQALLCLVDAQRLQGGGARLADARRNIEAARSIFESLGYEYGLSRVYQYRWVGGRGGAELFCCGQRFRAGAVTEPRHRKQRHRGLRPDEHRPVVRAAGPEGSGAEVLHGGPAVLPAYR